MKAKWLLLAKIQFLGAFGLNKLRHTDDARLKRRAGWAAAAIVLAFAVIVFYVVVISLLFAEQGIISALPAFMIAASSAIVFIFSLIRGSSMLFAAKDYDAVMSLPVKKSDVILSRLFTAYISNLLFALVVCVPASVVYFITAGFSVYRFFVILVSVLFSPLLPLTLATALGTVFTAVFARFKHKALWQSLAGILALAAILIASFAISYTSNSASADMNAVADFMAKKMYPPAALVSLATGGKVWAILAFAGANAAAYALFVACVSPFYTKINALLAAKSAGAAYNEKQIRVASAFGALVKKEMKRLFSSAAYLMNSLTGALFLLIMAVAFLIFDPIQLLNEVIAAQAGAELSADLFLYPCAAFALLFAGMTFPSASSITMEGKSRWIMCSLPIPAKTIFTAKSLVGFLFSAPFALFFSVVVCAQSNAAAPQWILLLLVPTVYCAFISMAGTFLNYKFPKYDWTNETSAIKNSVPVLILSLGGMVPEIALLVLSFMLGQNGFIPLLVLGGAALAGCFALWFGFFRRARLFDSPPSA